MSKDNNSAFNFFLDLYGLRFFFMGPVFTKGYFFFSKTKIKTNISSLEEQNRQYNKFLQLKIIYTN